MLLSLIDEAYASSNHYFDTALVLGGICNPTQIYTSINGSIPLAHTLGIRGCCTTPNYAKQEGWLPIEIPPVGRNDSVFGL